VRRENRPAEVRLPLPRLAFAAWRLLFAGRASAPERAPEKGVERGHYLVNHVAICGDCHTPRNALGSLDARMYLAGTADGPDGHPVPNITPDQATGVGSWDISDLTQLLQSGMKPDFDNVQGLMAEVIDGRAGGLGYTNAPPSDLRAMAAYLKTVKPIDHEVE
jgi:mono/diheme cytochrome c family protein